MRNEELEKLDVQGTATVEWLDMTFDGRHWALLREDPGFHQRFVAEVEADRIVGRWEASEDEGRAWRKDFDLLFERAPETSPEK